MLQRDRQRQRERGTAGGGGAGAFTAEYLVVAGGGGGGADRGGGGGAGGYRTAPDLSIALGTPYAVTVGAGGSGGSAGTPATNGLDSVFSSITSAGGGGGASSVSVNGADGGSGGGGWSSSGGGTPGGDGGSGNIPSTSPSQGNDGGDGQAGGDRQAGGGGGAGEAGNTDAQGHGGDGLASSITGSSVTRAGGGGGGTLTGTSYVGGDGGGGNGGGAIISGGNGTVNTGGGGGGGGDTSGNGGSGGSGVVIIRVPSEVVAEFSAGVVYNYIPLDDFNVYEITAAGAIDTVTFSQGTLATIDDSLRFNDDDSAYLSRTPSVAGDRKTWTWSGWVKRGNLGLNLGIFSAGTTSTSTIDAIEFNSSDQLRIYSYNLTYTLHYITTQLFRDPSAWYHILVAVDTTQSTASDRVKVYVNGVQVTSFGTEINPSINADCQFFNTTSLHVISATYNDSRYFDGYLSDVYLIDGQALDPSRFGKQDADGIWQPISYTGSYGTNGFHLEFADNSTAAALGTDTSGNGNDWTPSGITTDDQVSDTPSVNYATWNPLAKDISLTLANGNLDASASAAGAGGVISTIAVSSGKWYWEVQPTSGGAALAVGIADLPLASYVENVAGTYLYLSGGSKRISPSTTTAYGASFTDGDIIGVALDMDAGEVTFYKNNASQGVAFTGLEGTFAAWIQDGSGSTALVSTTNFGQRPFAYTPPTGFQALNSANLPAPTITDGKAHFQPALYTGNGTTQAIGGLEFQPDFVWIKKRNASSFGSHQFVDAVRGFNKYLFSDVTNAEVTAADRITSVDASGFTVGSALQVNESADTFVAWNWNAGGSTVTNTDGARSAQVRANTDAGFSIVTFDPALTGPASQKTSAGHGLNQAPELIITKSRNLALNWWTFTDVIDGSIDYFALNTTDAKTDDAHSLTITDTTFDVAYAYTSTTSALVAYCFHSVDGFSKFGSYTGNGSTNGPFIYTGFRPAFVMVKRTDTANGWVIQDSARDSYNATDKDLYPNLSDAEFTALRYDFLSNGFKQRNTFTGSNASGGTYIFMAFAENPFQLSRAR